MVIQIVIKIIIFQSFEQTFTCEFPFEPFKVNSKIYPNKIELISYEILQFIKYFKVKKKAIKVVNLDMD
jgi:hypothetical protein